MKPRDHRLVDSGVPHFVLEFYNRILPGIDNHVYAYYYIVLEYSSTVLKYGCTRMNCHVSFATLLTELAVRPRLILKGPRRRPWPAHMAPVPAPVQQPEVARGSLRGVNPPTHSARARAVRARRALEQAGLASWQPGRGARSHASGEQAQVKEK